MIKHDESPSYSPSEARLLIGAAEKKPSSRKKKAAAPPEPLPVYTRTDSVEG